MHTPKVEPTWRFVSTTGSSGSRSGNVTCESAQEIKSYERGGFIITSGMPCHDLEKRDELVSPMTQRPECNSDRGRKEFGMGSRLRVCVNPRELKWLCYW